MGSREKRCDPMFRVTGLSEYHFMQGFHNFLFGIPSGEVEKSAPAVCRTGLFSLFTLDSPYRFVYRAVTTFNEPVHAVRRFMCAGI
jgi:hypothetical protein